MTLLFIHDIKALLLDNNVFARSYGPTIWKRYLNTFSDILVCTRSRNGTSQLIEGIDKLNGENVKFDYRIGMFRGPEVFFSSRIKNILREDVANADGVVIRLDSFLGLLAEKECRKQRKPYVIEVVGCAWDSFWNHGVAGKVLAPFMFLMMKRAVKKAQYTIYVTKKFLQRRYPTTGISTNISNVSLPPADETILKNRILKIKQTDLNSSLHLMTTANVGVRYKGFQYVIKALWLIKRKYNRCNLIYHIVGEGNQSYLRDIAEKYKVSENVVFHGAMPHSAVFDLLKEIDIYIQPSLQEGLPRAMIEAMSCAVPCIGTDVAGIPELINDKFIYKRGRKMPQEIARLLREFDLNTLEQEAINNFDKAKDYDSHTLNSRRDEFLKKIYRINKFDKMNVRRNISFSPPDMSEAEIQEVAEALRSGWITTGPKTKEFEHLISMCCQTARMDAEGKPLPTTACLNSATACMELALRVLGIGEGDEVIVPAYTYTATASSVCHVGARPVFVDCAPGSFEMDYDKLAELITERTKAIIPVDLGGVVADYDKVFAAVETKKHLFRPANDIQRAYGRCIVIADAAHAFGAMWHSKMCGEIADFTSFSFHAVKNLTTAEGGALTWRAHEGLDDTAIYKQLQLLSLHGQNKDALAKTKLGGWEYDIIGTWYKCNMTDVMAGIGLAQLKRYPEMLRRRRQLIERYNVALQPLGVQVLPHYGNEHSSSGHLYLTRIPGITVEQRNDIIVKMAERGIATNVHYKPLPMMTAYKALGYDIKDYPNAYEQYHNEITLPLHTRLTDEDVDYILSNFIEIIKAL